MPDLYLSASNSESLPLPAAAGTSLPPVPWRDPHSVKPEDLKSYIEKIKSACELEPANADLRTVLGMAHAMNFDAYASMDAFEEAKRLNPASFWAHYKYSELMYRLRALDHAEEQTSRALDLACNSWEMSLCRRQLQEIRKLRRDGTQKPAWTKPLGAPAATLICFALIIFLGYLVH